MIHAALIAPGNTPSEGGIGVWFLALAFALAGVAVLYLWPHAKCRKCTGSGKLFSPLGDDHWRTCPRCSGSGKRMRTGRQIIGLVSKRDAERGRK